MCWSSSRRPATVSSSSTRVESSPTAPWRRCSAWSAAARSRRCSRSSCCAVIQSGQLRTLPTSWLPMRDRLLVRHFLWRFLEHDFISTNADRREALSASGGILIAVSLFVSVLTALKYQFDNFMPPGIASLQFIDDRFMFVSASMLVMALLAVALWDALALDVRDGAVLGILPVPRSAIVRSKFIAVAILAAGTDLAWNAAPILLRSWSLPLMLKVGGTGALVLTL